MRFLFLLFSLLSTTALFAQITNSLEVPTSINPTGTTPDASAMLDVQSLTKGILVPRMNSAQRSAIASPATGLLVFDTNTLSFWFFDGTAWVNLSANLADADGDTKVEVEQTPDEDVIHFEAGGKDLVQMNAQQVAIDGKLAVGTSTTTATLEVAGGPVLFEGATGTTPVFGPGTRFMWIPEKAALRAGQVSGNQWDDFNIGTRSIVLGADSEATGFGSVVIGGFLNGAFASDAFVAGGFNNIASGESAFTGSGVGLRARSLGEVAFGLYNTDYTPVAPSSFNGEDRLLVIGNGTDSNNRSNAVTVLKNGKVGIGTDDPKLQLHINPDTSNLTSSLSSFGTGLVITGKTFKPRLYFEDLGAQPDEKVMFAQMEDGRLSWNSVNDAGNAFETANILVLESGGNIGIGTNTPTEKLAVNGNIKTDRGSNTQGLTRSIIISGARNANTDPFASLEFENYDNNAASPSPYTAAKITAHNSLSDEEGDLRFYTNDGSSLQQQMIIDRSGKVGIGTSAPDVPLQVNGGSDITPSSGGYIVTNSTSGSNVAIDENEIMARDNGTTSTLFLNRDGGRVAINGNASTVYLGVGTNSPSQPLHIKSPTSSLIRLERGDIGQVWDINAGSADFNIFDASSQSTFFIIENGSGRVGIGRTPAGNRLEVNGNASKSSAGNWLANSDARLKTNIQALDSEAILQKMLALQGITYEWNDDQTENDRPEGIQYGFTAQNIQEVFPELVSEDGQGFLQTAYGTYDAMQVEVIRALNDKIEKLEAENANLQAQLHKVDDLKAELSAIRAAIEQAGIAPE